MKKLLKGIGIIFVILIVGVVGLFSCANSRDKKEMEEKSQETYEWPDSDLVKQLPKPTSKNGEVVSDSDTYFRVEVYANKDEYKSYIKKCKNKGFTVNHNSSSEMYMAKNNDGYSITIMYNEQSGDNPELYTISLTAPKEEKEETQETTTDNSSQTTEQTNSYGTYDDFKALMDSYEQFFDKYVDFMKKYNESSDNKVSMVKDYADMMAQYADMTSKMNAINQDELTSEELSYYVEVTGRITQKLAEVTPAQ